MEQQLRNAAVDGDLPTVQRILQQPGGVNVNAGTQRGLTALHYAAECTVLGIVQAILQVEGVNVNARTMAGCTPLHLACRRSHPNQFPIIQALLQAGADPNAADGSGETPMFPAVCSGRISVVQALLDGGASPAARNNNLNTPLHSACFWGRLDVAQFWIQRQGSECLTLKNNREETPLDRVGQTYLGIPIGVQNSIQQRILQAYAGLLAQRDVLLCLHSVLQNTTFIDGNDEEFQLPIGKLNTEYLQSLLEYIIAVEPGSVRALDIDGLLPLQVARQLNFPDLVLNVLLRPYPDALLLL